VLHDQGNSQGRKSRQNEYAVKKKTMKEKVISLLGLVFACARVKAQGDHSSA
jgi:hypothetical protein